MKDVIEEFSAYVQESNDFYNNAKDDDRDDEVDSNNEEDSRDSDDKPYTEEEAKISAQCLVLMHCTQATLQFSLSTLTAALDQAFKTKCDSDEKMDCWMSQMHETLSSLRSRAFDLSSELHVPFDRKAILEKFVAGESEFAAIVRLIKDENFIRYCIKSDVDAFESQNKMRLEEARILIGQL